MAIPEDFSLPIITLVFVQDEILSMGCLHISSDFLHADYRKNAYLLRGVVQVGKKIVCLRFQTVATSSPIVVQVNADLEMIG